MVLVCFVIFKVSDHPRAHEGKLPSCQFWRQKALWLWRYNFLSLSRDLNVMASPAPAYLVSFETTPLDVPACQIWWS